MEGRAHSFADPEIVRMAKEDFVSVACDDWYQRRRQDAEGRFFMDVSNQGPRGGDHTNTRQGIYMLTAGGKLLAYKNAGQAPDVMREVMREALAAWNRLPAEERTPGAVAVEAHGPVDSAYGRTPPENGLIVNVHARVLDKKDGKLVDAVCEVGDDASVDHMWLTEAEWRSLIPSGAKAGDSFDVPSPIARRIMRYHLVDNTRGEPNFWSPEQVREGELKATVEKADAKGVKLRLDGKALLTTDADPAAADRGFDAALLGYVEYDAAADQITRFDLVAAGDHWGEGAYTGGARPGRQPFGVAFALSSAQRPGDSVPPQGARDLGGYLSAQ